MSRLIAISIYLGIAHSCFEMMEMVTSYDLYLRSVCCRIIIYFSLLNLIILCFFASVEVYLLIRLRNLDFIFIKILRGLGCLTKGLKFHESFF